MRLKLFIGKNAQSGKCRFLLQGELLNDYLADGVNYLCDRVFSLVTVIGAFLICSEWKDVHFLYSLRASVLIITGGALVSI